MNSLRMFRSLLLGVVLSIILAVPALAEESNVKEIILGDENSGYKLLIPNYIEMQTMKAPVEDEVNFEEVVKDFEVMVLEQPTKNSDGTYSVFEVITTDSKAARLWPNQGLYEYGGYTPAQFTEPILEEFKDGKATARLSTISKTALFEEPKPITVNTKTFLRFYIDIFDKDGNQIESFVGPYLTFTDKTSTKKEQSSQNNPVAKIETVTATPTASKVVVNGKSVSFDAYTINNSNYFKLRDLAMAINGTEKNFEVAWDNEKNAINLIPNTAYTAEGNELTVAKVPTKKQAKITQSKLYLNGQEAPFNAYNIDNNNYFKLRDIATIINFGVSWNEKANAISIETNVDYKE